MTVRASLEKERGRETERDSEKERQRAGGKKRVFRVLDKVDTLKYEGVSAMLPDPALTLHTVFTNILFVKSNFAFVSRNISALQ